MQGDISEVETKAPSALTTESSTLKISSYQSDPLACFLLDRLHLTPRTFALAMFGWAAVVNLALPTLIIGAMPQTYGEGGWYRYLLYLTASGIVVFNLLIPPVIGGYYLWLSRVPQELFPGLVATETLKLDSKQKLDLSSGLDTLFRQRWADKAAPVAILVFAMWYLTMFHFEAPRFGSIPFATATAESLMGSLENKIDVGILAAIPWMVVSVYWVAMIIVRGRQNIRGLSRAFRAPVIVEPLHPDKCGGLLIVNRYAIRLSYLIAACGFGLGLLALANSFRGWAPVDSWLFA